MSNTNIRSSNNEGLFKRLNINVVKAIPYKPGVVERYFKSLTPKNESQRPKTDITRIRPFYNLEPLPGRFELFEKLTTLWIFPRV